MPTDADYIQQLKQQQAEYADQALTKPKDKTEFGFGRACGVYQGLLLAEQLFQKVIGEEDDEP